MGWVRRALAISALTLLALLAFLLIAYTFSTLPQWGVGAVTFKLELYDESGKLYTDILGREAIPGNFRIYAQVFAITPPDDPAVIREVFRGEVRGLTLRIEARGLFKEIVDKWVSFEERRGTLPANPATALQLNLWIMDKDSGELLQWVSYYYHYSPVKVKAGGEERHTVKIAVPPKKSEGGKPQLCAHSYEWIPRYRVMPENYTEGYGNHIRYHNGAYYVRTPVLTLYNYNKSYPGNSPMTAFISMASGLPINFYVSIGAGFELSKKLMQGDIAGVIAELDKKVYMGGVTSQRRVHFGDIMSMVKAGEEAYIYIWTRPTLVFYEEWIFDSCTGTSQPTGREKVDFLIQDAIMWCSYGKDRFECYLYGGVLKEPLPPFIRNWIFNDSLTESKYIMTLGSGEADVLDVIIDYRIDVCNVNGGIPTAILLAPVLSAKLPWALPLAVLIAPIVGESDDSEIFVAGVIKNEGDTHYETLYMRLSKVQYRKDPPWYCLWCDPCYYGVPVGMYFISE